MAELAIFWDHLRHTPLIAAPTPSAVCLPTLCTPRFKVVRPRCLLCACGLCSCAAARAAAIDTRVALEMLT